MRLLTRMCPRRQWVHLAMLTDERGEFMMPMRWVDELGAVALWDGYAWWIYSESFLP